MCWIHTRKEDVRLSEKLSSNLHGARPVHQIITMIQWTLTRRLTIKKCLYKVYDKGLLLSTPRHLRQISSRGGDFGDTIPCKVTAVILHGVVSPDLGIRPRARRPE